MEFSSTLLFTAVQFSSADAASKHCIWFRGRMEAAEVALYVVLLLSLTSCVTWSKSGNHIFLIYKTNM